jgi:hypothetical protein
MSPKIRTGLIAGLVQVLVVVFDSGDLAVVGGTLVVVSSRGSVQDFELASFTVCHSIDTFL